MKQDQNLFIKERTSQFWKATIALSFGSFLVFSNLHFTQPLLPLISKEFKVSHAMASLTVSLVTLSFSLFLLIAGPISDHIGRKNLMSFGLLSSSLFSLAIFLLPISGSFSFYERFRGLLLLVYQLLLMPTLLRNLKKKP
ncbi:MFS transporter [Neobacillus drentensis]